MENKKAIVFLSHSSKDKDLLIPFRDALQDKTNGTIQFFLSSDGQSIPVGHNWVASLEHSLDEAKLAFLLLTANSISSTWVAFEAGFMHAKKIRVIPVALPGIDMAQVPPPIGLLQGFNMHSFGAMNNFFEILNSEFQHKHKPTFTEDDFQKMFGAKSSLASGFFGEYSAFVNSLRLTGNLAGPSFLDTVKLELKNNGLEIAVHSPKQISATGVSVIQNGGWYEIRLHADMFSLLLGGMISAIFSTCQPHYGGNLEFIKETKTCGSGIDLTVRAHGTEFKVLPDGFCFRSLQIEPLIDSINFSSAGPFTLDDFRDLVIGLFRTGIFQFTPKEPVDQNILRLRAAVATLARKQRGY